jgi:hypothetical protein
MVINIDEDLINSDWLKSKWNLPSYKSFKFMEILHRDKKSLDQFKQLPVYKWAVKNGLIKDDEWTGSVNEMP